ncbi:DNA-directed RNA polymerase subunit alpha C-terminal domain-containing protein [Rubinisphaera italica]|nr:DNA-directed RNA polymerase subunit alpha C-terminal domain-containing protein [Rubinisphaera italica]
MIAIEQIDVRQPILESTDFGNDQIKTILRALAEGQAAEVRQYWQEVSSRATSQRDLLAAGIIAYLLAHQNKAIEILSKVQGSGLASFYQAQAQFSLENYDEARSLYEQAKKSGYDPILCDLLIAGSVRLSGDIDEAEKMLRGLARDAATRAEYSYQMGCIMADRGDTYGALEYFERAVDMDNSHSRALFSLAQLNNQLGNDDDAIRLYEQMLAKPPFYLGSLINLGLLYEDREMYAPAAFCFQRALEANPNDERAALYLKDIESSAEMFFDEDAVRRDKQVEQILQIPITDFELSARSRNCLERAGIDRLEDLTKMTEEQLLAGKNFGETSLKEIREILEMHGLKLGQNVHRKQPEPLYRPEELSPEERAMHEAGVGELDLSVRARKCLSRLGIATIGELVSRSADELLSVRNFGVTSLNEIREKLGDKNIRLRGD